MKIISPNRRSTDDLFTTKELQGKRVISERGADSGIITNIYTDTKSFKGVGVKYRRTEYFIDKTHIHEASEDAVILTIHPYYLLIGKKAYSKDGTYMGKVKDITRKGNRNKADTILIKRHFWSTTQSLKTSKIVKAKEVVVIDNNR